MQPGFAQGNITTQNLNPLTGVPTPNSFVQLPTTQDYDTIAIQVTGTYTGVLTVQGTVDGVNWVALGGTQALTNLNTAVQSATIASAAVGVWQADISGLQGVRVTALAAVTGTAVVSLVGSQRSGIVGIDTPIALTSLPAPATATTTSMTKAEDAVAATGDSGIFILGVRRDAPTISASATGDYNEIAVSKQGAMFTQVIDAVKKTYATGGKVTPFAGTVLEIFGAAATTVEINRVTLTLFGTAAGKMDVIFNKRSTASTGGTSTTPAKVPYDAADAASAAGVKLFTVAPTNGTIIGLVRQGMLSVNGTTDSGRLKVESGQYAKSFTLTAAAQAITIELAGTVPTGAELAIDIEWTEY